jgi:hypothetical protein
MTRRARNGRGEAPTRTSQPQANHFILPCSKRQGRRRGRTRRRTLLPSLSFLFKENEELWGQRVV